MSIENPLGFTQQTKTLVEDFKGEIWVARACTFGSPTAICWKLPRPASGQSIDVCSHSLRPNANALKELENRVAGGLAIRKLQTGNFRFGNYMEH